MLRLGLAVLIYAASASASAADLAAVFGAREQAMGARLSPDGTHVSFIASGPRTEALLFVAPVDGSAAPAVALRSGTQGVRIRECDWGSNEHLWCALWSEARTGTSGRLVTYQRLIAVGRDGQRARPIGRDESSRALGFSTSDGDILYAPYERPGTVLLERYVPEESSEGTLVYNKVGGYAVEKVDLATGRRQMVEKPTRIAKWYLPDTTGAIRMMAATNAQADKYDDGSRTYFVRRKGSNEWTEIGRSRLGDVFEPEGFDDSGDWIYVLKPHNGRRALFRVAANNPGLSELVFAHDRVDVTGVKTLGPRNRVVGVQYSDEFDHIEYFDPELKKLNAQIGKALKGSPIVAIVGESDDRQRLLIFAGSDRDPGRYYLLDKPTKQLRELLPVRGELKDVALGEMKPVRVRARDGVEVPAYLTLPPGREAKNLPAIVMPHGGPSSRDSWGFDWLVQFYAASGYAVIQPNYRGSSGYGEDWFKKNGIQSWDAAMRDVADAGRWLVAQGIADPKRLAIVGWSYGGYAALQTNAIEPGLFKAAIAIAPVTDLLKLRDEASDESRSDFRIAQDEFGASDSNLVAGSPARRAAAITAPVLLFHGDRDSAAPIGQSRVMESALKEAGKPVELVVYPGLAHSLEDSTARTDMLSKSAAFLERNLGKPDGAAVAGGTD